MSDSAKKGRSFTIARALIVLLAAASHFAANAQLPDKPIKIIVPFTPGGTVDLIGRAVAAKMGENLARAFA